MEKKKIGFAGEKYSETSLEDFFEKWILISLRGNGAYSGKLIEINDDKIGLLPYQKVTYDNNGMAIHRVIKEGLPYPHTKIDIVSYRLTSEEEVSNYCKNLNRKTYLEYLRENREIFELEEQMKKIREYKK